MGLENFWIYFQLIFNQIIYLKIFNKKDISHQYVHFLFTDFIKCRQLIHVHFYQTIFSEFKSELSFNCSFSFGFVEIINQTIVIYTDIFWSLLFPPLGRPSVALAINCSTFEFHVYVNYQDFIQISQRFLFKNKPTRLIFNGVIQRKPIDGPFHVRFRIQHIFLIRLSHSLDQDKHPLRTALRAALEGVNNKRFD
jgi:hypothetical protein